MKDDVYQMIREEFKKGSNEKKAFLSICQQRQLEVPLKSNVNKWINRLRDLDDSLEGDIGESHCDLLFEIVWQYIKFKHVTFYYNDWKEGSEAIILNRFVLCGQSYAKSFTLFDSFNKDSRTIQTLFANRGTKFVGVYALIGDGRVLLNVVEGDGEHLLLVSFDFVQLEYFVLDDIPLNFACCRIIMDSVEDSQFMIYAYDNELTLICKGHMANDKIHIDVPRIEFGVRLFNYELNGNKFFAFEGEQGNWTSWKFVEYDLSSNSASKVREWHLSKEFAKLLSFGDEPVCVWENNRMYSDCFYDQGFSIIVFDSDALTLSKTRFIGSGYVDAISIDEDQILTVSASKYCFNDQWNKTVYRIPMKKPDKLRYIAWNTIRRQFWFFESDVYEKLMLPYNSEFRSIFEEE